ncbi:MAG: MFS transporter [Verrucomicrobia bacterium]|nr:MFS transporter [Verrucomicrobiota bacterium]
MHNSDTSSAEPDLGLLSPSMRFAFFGAGLIAVSFGLARFAFGLFVPSIRDDMGLDPRWVGLIGALPLISFVLASLVASEIAHRLGARNATVLASGFAVVGLGLISQASNVFLLGAGVFICGISTGLMMPALAAAMQALVDRSVHGRVSSIMNAGTSIGVAVAVPMALFLAGVWRGAYLSFAILAAVGLIASFYFIPAVSRVMPGDAAPPPAVSLTQLWRLLWLSTFAFTMGLISAAFWVFAPDLAVTLGALSPSQSAWLWLGVGIAGLGGAAITDLADRNNPPIMHALMLALLSASLVLLAASPGQILIAVFSALVFGLAYMSLTGLYLLTGIRLLPGRLSLGPVLPFLACALGQAVGSPLIGLLVEQLGYADAFSTFAAFGIVVALLSPLYPKYIEEALSEEEIAEQENLTGIQAAYDYQLLNEDGQPIHFDSPEEQAVEETENEGK